MFDHVEVAVRVNSKELRYVKMDRVLLQGSLLSPLLFNVFIGTYRRPSDPEIKGLI